MDRDFFASDAPHSLWPTARYDGLSVPIWDLPEALFLVADDGAMRLLNPQAEELASDSHLHAVHFDPEMFQRGWF